MKNLEENEMVNFDWKAAIGRLAPTLAGMFGTPIMGAGVGLLCKVLGLEATPENAQLVAEQAAAGQLTGEQLIALRKAESDAKLALEELGLSYNYKTNELEVRNTESARAREVAIKDKTPAIGFYACSLGFFSLLIILAFHSVPESSRDLLNIMLGALGLAWGNQVKYYYGGAAGDDRVNEMLHSSIPANGKENSGLSLKTDSVPDPSK